MLIQRIFILSSWTTVPSTVGFSCRFKGNIILLFQPEHTPQVNPIERLWKEIKKDLSWKLFDNLDDLRVIVGDILQGFIQKVIASITGWDFIQRSTICGRNLVKWYKKDRAIALV